MQNEKTAVNTNNIIILLIQKEQIPTSELNNQWICKLKKSLNQRQIYMKKLLLYMKKLSNTVNHSNKLILTYFFRALFINLFFKTKHSNETFHLGFYSLSNVFSYIKHISSKSNISVLTIFGTSRNTKIIAPSPHFVINPPILWYSLNIPWGSFY